MQILSNPIRREAEGYALLITMIFLAVTLMVFASMMYWISSNANVTNRNNQFNMSEAAAEAATESVLAQMNHDFFASSLSNNATYYAKFIPGNTNADGTFWPVQYVYSGTNGSSTNQISVSLGAWSTNTQPLNSQFTGLYGLVMPVTLTATATPIGQSYNVPATLSESIQFATIPLFQFAIFYNLNLEMCPGQGMYITGPVFCNQNIWEGSTFLTNSSSVSAVGTNDTTSVNPFITGYSPQGGTPAANFLMAGQPTHNNDPITMPIGTNNDPAAIEGILALPPAAYAMNTSAAFSTNGQIYLANQADLYITNSASGTNDSTPTGTNTFIFYSDSGNSPYLTPVPPDYYLMKNGISTNYIGTNQLGYFVNSNVLFASYSFINNALFYDWREGWNGGSGIGGKGKAVQALEIDISKLSAWLGNGNKNGGTNYTLQCELTSHKSRPIDSIYVYNAVPLTGTTLPAVRVINGSILPSYKGLTVATPMPMYVLGNYNVQQSSAGASDVGLNTTHHTYPAALMADAITVLSGNWNDATTIKLPTPTTTTINAAMLEGIVQSTNGMYSGGVENFMRLLENWSGSSLWYNGSIVVMFPSQYATNYWNGSYYGVPTRRWAFDLNFASSGGLPPMTPQSQAIVRGSWNASP
jgi:hypothetical protein